MKTYIEPFPGYYSEVLQIPARLKLTDFKARERILGSNHREEQSQCRWKPIPDKGANHREGTVLPCRCRSEGDKEHFPVPQNSTFGTRGDTAKIALVGLQPQV